MKTTAKLDSINVSGDCKCDGAPVAPDPIVEMVFVIDGSDSFNRKSKLTLRPTNLWPVYRKLSFLLLTHSAS